MAGMTIYQRGAHYQQLGAVLDLCSQHDSLSATVAGSNFNDYHVQLWVADDKLACACSCPMGIKAVPCKHAVAAGLAWLHKHSDDVPPSEAPRG